MNDTTWTCDRCDELNDISGVTIVEHCDGIGEVVCKACLRDEYAEEMKRAE
jgi:transcription elongation factor Elf1